MSSLFASTLLAYLILSSGAAYSESGVRLRAPAGYAVTNIDPTLNSTLNNQIYDPNFIPGFSAGLGNVSVTWRSGPGYADIGYLVGAWNGEGGTVPHMAVGPQCCNFVEVPHTQQFRLPAWGDYYYVRAGLGPPGVNVQNYTSSFGSSATYVGLRTDWNWTVSLSLAWSHPRVTTGVASEGAIGIAATQYVADEPGRLVYTVVDFWMDPNSSRSVVQSPDGIGREVLQPNVVVYHPFQLSESGNQTVTVDLSWYLSDTLRALQLPASESQPPVVSYVYLNVEGYNFGWNGTLWSFFVMTPARAQGSLQPGGALALAAGVAAGATVVSYALVRRRRRSRTTAQGGGSSPATTLDREAT